MSHVAPTPNLPHVTSSAEHLAADALEARLRAFELRLFHGGLIARAAFPAGALLILAISAGLGEVRWTALLVWLALAVWTSATAPSAWSRLPWLRTVPLVVAAELVVFCLIVYVGFGSRPWHLLHAFVPLALVACFAGPWPARAMTAGVIAALWAGWLTVWIWPSAPIDPPMAALMPTALAVVGYGLVRYARRLMDDLGAVISAQRTAAAALRRARTRVAAAEARRHVHERVRARVADLAEGLGGALPTGSAGTDEGRTLAALLRQIEVTAAELGGRRVATESRALEDVTRRAVDDTAPLGGHVHVRIADGAAGADLGSDATTIRRLLTEAVANARKHGLGDVEVVVEASPGPRVIVVNPASGPARGRAGHIGLEAIRADATAVGAAVEWDYREGSVRLELRLRPEEPEDGAPADDAVERLRATTERRRLAYERGMLVARLAVCLIATALIPIKADQHRTILPLLLATAVVLVLWNATLLARWTRVRPLVRERTRLVWLDAGAMTAILALEGGMSTPWIPLSMGSIIFVAYYRPLREGLLLVGLFSLALLVGYALMRTLPVDDAGTLVQEMPLGWAINVAAFLIVLAISGSIAWVFRRTDEAIAIFEETMALERRAVRDQAEVEARAEGRRDLHATLLQFVAAAQLRLDPPPDAASGAAVDALRARLEAISGALRATMAELDGHGPARGEPIDASPAPG